MTSLGTTGATAPTRRGLLLGATALTGLALARHTLPAGAATAAASTGSTGTTGVDALAAEQSPIDIRPRTAVTRPGTSPLTVHYPRSTSVDLAYVRRDQTSSTGCSSRRDDETVEASGFSTGGFVTRDGQRYRLLQTHFHIASEHTVDGRRFAMEQHFVHQRESDGRLLVVGVFLIGGGSAPQDRLLARLPRECGEEGHVSSVDLNGMLPGDLTSWSYDGSLTTPPYDEGVLWHVVRTPRTVSQATIDRFRALFPAGNARAVQPLNNRTITVVPGQRG